MERQAARQGRPATDRINIISINISRRDIFTAQYRYPQRCCCSLVETFFVFTIWSVTTNLKLSFFFGRNFFAFNNTFPDQSVFLSFAHTKSAVHGRPSDLNSWQPQHSITFSNWEKRLHRLITNLGEHVRSGWSARAREKSPFQTKSCYHLLASSDIAANNKLSSPISCSPSSSSSSASFSVPNTQYTRDCALSLVNWAQYHRRVQMPKHLSL